MDDPVARPVTLPTLPTHDYFALLRMVELLYPAMPPLGTAPSPSQEPVRVGHRASVAFEPAMVRARACSSGDRLRLDLVPFALIGANGPMPLPWSEDVVTQTVRYGGEDLIRFLDILIHRVALLWYRSWAQGRPIADITRMAGGRFAEYLKALSGASRFKEGPRNLAREWGIFADRRRGPGGLIRLLENRLHVSVGLQSFAGRWVVLATQERLSLRQADPVMLGHAPPLGARAWCVQHAFRLRVGPMPLRQYRDFLPGRPMAQRLGRCVHDYVGHRYEWSADILLADEAPLTLGLDGRRALGFDTWLASTPQGTRYGRFVFDPDVHSKRFPGD